MVANPQPVNIQVNVQPAQINNNNSGLNFPQILFENTIGELRMASNILDRESNSTPRRRGRINIPPIQPLTKHRVPLRPYVARGPKNTKQIVADLQMTMIFNRGGQPPPEPLLPNEPIALETTTCTFCLLIPKVDFQYLKKTSFPYFERFRE